MRLRKFLREMSTPLRNKVIKWAFGRHNYEIIIISDHSVQYRSIGGVWRDLAIRNITDDEIVSLEVGKRSLINPPILHITTQG